MRTREREKEENSKKVNRTCTKVKGREGGRKSVRA
jgi:hypothetical protein